MPQASSTSWLNFCFSSTMFFLMLMYSLSFLGPFLYCFNSSKISVSNFTFFV